MLWHVILTIISSFGVPMFFVGMIRKLIMLFTAVAVMGIV